MATAKKPTPAANQKTAPARKVVKPSGQAMDIIPKNRVRPSTTSRPVITRSIPVADNTMTSPSGTPTLQIKRRQITITPPQDSELRGPEEPVDVASGEPAMPVSITTEQGVSVAELIAKRKDRSPDSANDTDTAITDILPGTTPELPVAVVEDAAAEAARLLADESIEDQAGQGLVAENPETPDVSEEVIDETVDQPDVKSDEIEQPIESDILEDSVEETEPSPETAKPIDDSNDSSATKPDKQANSDMLADLLKDDIQQPQEHSQALKDELQKNSDENKSELYGGKPVIVVHKERGPMSAVAWVLWFFLCLALALVAVNFLLDAGFIETNYQIPHTNIL